MRPIIVLIQQDLRLQDHPALYHAAKEDAPIIPLYIHDEDKSWSLNINQKWWLWKSLTSLKQTYAKRSANLIIRKGNTIDHLKEIVEKTDPSAIYWNRRYEPLSLKKQNTIKESLKIPCREFIGSLIAEPWDVANKEGNFFKVFTPFWKKLSISFPPNTSLKLPSFKGYSKSLKSESPDIFKTEVNSEIKSLWVPGENQAHQILLKFLRGSIANYSDLRDYPKENATSHLSPYLHFGEITPRQIWHAVAKKAPFDKTFIKELGWREFSYYLLYHYPQLTYQEFRKDFLNFPWKKEDKKLKAWQQGMTGYPIVDAGMRELLATGYMHNRVRMITASFLCKDLLIDWREGAKWFWEHLIDADLANNSASWQWVAGCGVDAAPYFRIFNPTTQEKKFDPEKTYIRKWVPEIGTEEYPKPIIDHQEARKKALETYERRV